MLIRHISQRKHLSHTKAERSPLRERGGSPFVIIFGGADSCWPTLGAGIVEARSTNANEICCFPPVGFQGFPSTWCNWENMTRCHILAAASWKLSSFHLLFRSLSGLAIILYFRRRLFSWRDYWIGGLTSVWILDSSLLGLPTKPYINLLSIANDRDHTVTLVRHSTCLTGSCQKYLSFCQPHSPATASDSMFFYKAFSRLPAQEDEDGVARQNDRIFKRECHHVVPKRLWPRTINMREKKTWKTLYL